MTNHCIGVIACRVVAGLALVALTPVQAAKPFFNFEAGLDYDSNVSRAEFSSDSKDDLFLSAAAGAGLNFIIGERGGLRLKADARYQRFFELSDLSNLNLRGSVEYRRQFGNDFDAPWFGLGGSYSLTEFNDSDIRDGQALEGVASAGRQWTDRLSVRGGFKYKIRSARSGRTFDAISRGLFIDSDFRFNDNTILYAGYSLRRGDVVSSTFGGFPKIGRASEAFAMDPALGAGFVAWRLDGTTHRFELGGNYAITRDQAIDISGRYFRTDGRLDNDWSGWGLSARYLLRFR